MNLKGELRILLLTFPRLFAVIRGERVHDLSMNTLEYCGEVRPASFAVETSAGVQGGHEECRTSGNEGDETSPLEPLSIWLPAAVIMQMLPHLINSFEGNKYSKKLRNATHHHQAQVKESERGKGS
ncbi:hypothetical protein K439DRAFT_816848 [Ramaria rubella]|nr:hypothetical protein K439DRAFT_816848 [Ramaria rubella]